MNLYILVEGKTERKVYPEWLAQLVPHLSKVDRPDLVRQNNYCIVLGGGYDSLMNYLEQSVEEINRVGIFNFFLVIVDADDKSVAETELEIRSYLTKKGIKLSDLTDFVIVVQRCCIETWFLGNRLLFKKNPQDTELSNWIKHFNVSVNDPELMLLPTNVDVSIGNFHKMYLKKMLAERHVSYTELYPRGVVEVTYLNEIIKRFNETGHIATFGNLLNFCKKLNTLDN